MMECRYISVRDAAQILGVSTSTIRNFLLKNQYFKGKRVGRQLRIEKDSFTDYVNGTDANAPVQPNPV